MTKHDINNALLVETTLNDIKTNSVAERKYQKFENLKNLKNSIF